MFCRARRKAVDGQPPASPAPLVAVPVLGCPPLRVLPVIGYPATSQGLGGISLDDGHPKKELTQSTSRGLNAYGVEKSFDQLTVYLYTSPLGRIPDCMTKLVQYSARAQILSYSKRE